MRCCPAPQLSCRFAACPTVMSSRSFAGTNRSGSNAVQSVAGLHQALEHVDGLLRGEKDHRNQGVDFRLKTHRVTAMSIHSPGRLPGRDSSMVRFHSLGSAMTWQRVVVHLAAQLDQPPEGHRRVVVLDRRIGAREFHEVAGRHVCIGLEQVIGAIAARALAGDVGDDAAAPPPLRRGIRRVGARRPRLVPAPVAAVKRVRARAGYAAAVMGRARVRRHEGTRSPGGAA